jgi:hypothetical protein
MLNETNRSFTQEFPQMFQVVPIHEEPEEHAPAPAAQRQCDADMYERAIQALRDVRHLLPYEGVAIVDRVLGPTL